LRTHAILLPSDAAKPETDSPEPTLKQKTSSRLTSSRMPAYRLLRPRRKETDDVFQVSDRAFDELVKQAIARLPDEFRQALDVVRVEVRPRPTAAQLRSVGLSEDELLLGLYEGVPLTERSVQDGPRTPDAITLFKEDLEDAVDDEGELQEQVRITLFHELGHYFGFDEDQLDALGFG
jgi:predicted Zn-dependent protease with MMP-like domain